MEWSLSYSSFMTAVTVVVTLQAIFVGAAIVTERRHHTSKLAWLLMLVFLPLAGLFLYLLFGRVRPALRMRKRREANEAFEERILAPQRPVGELADGVKLPATLRAVVSITLQTSGAAVTSGNSVEILSTGFSKFMALSDAIRLAREYVHLEYYIVRDDETGRAIRKALIEAVERGVRVRLLLDGAGSFYLPGRFLKPLREAGAQVATFLPIRFPFLTARRDFRNHRKLVVIDGREAFLGGMNIGDEYSGQSKSRQPWRDTHAHVTGPCVAGLDEVFAEDWFHATRETLARAALPEGTDSPGDQIVQVVASGPDRYWRTFQQVAFQVIAGAQRRVSITTPYFIPDVSILMALQTAALGGVQVRILAPERPNFPLLRAAQRSFYEELLRAGVQIFEYLPGMLHAKTLEVDGEYALIGSANMDIRSFRLNFELGLSVMGGGAARRLNEDFENDLAQSREFTMDDVRRRSRGARFAYSLAQMASPLL